MADGAPPLSQQLLRALGDRMYEKRKGAALDIERTIRELLQKQGPGAFEIVRSIITLLKNDFAYNVLQNNARNGGLIGLAGVAIALGPDLLGHYLDDLLPPILACFSDQDSKVRYYACESLYNVAKVARREILRWFNDIFDVLSQLAADTDTAVKSAAELLDRLLKDIVSEESIETPLQNDPDAPPDPPEYEDAPSFTVRFSLQGFIPLLSERIHTLNPFTRLFLVSWITLLDSVPELELVSFLPDFLDGLFKYLSDENEQVRVGTASILSEFLRQIREAVEIQRLENQEKGIWVPGQTVNLQFAKMVQILQPYLVSMDEDTMSTAMRWMNAFILISHRVMMMFAPILINAVLPCLAHNVPTIRSIAVETNKNLFDLVATTTVDAGVKGGEVAVDQSQDLENSVQQNSEPGTDKQTSDASKRASYESSLKDGSHDGSPTTTQIDAQSDFMESAANPFQLDYQAIVSSLVGQFLHENEETRVAALDWMLMLHKKAPKKIVSNEGSFVALLQILSDTSDEVVRRALQLLAQISLYSDDEYFMRFLSKILSIFSSDRRLLETRGSLIIRQLCLALTPEKIYRCMAEILEKDEDLEFASTMVQNLSLILITAVELSDLRARLRSLDSKDGQGLFVALYKCWCHNPVSTFSLCLLAQYYEHAANLLQVFAEIEITVNFLVQIDKLVQLLESPVFTYLRLQLLEPERYPHLYKCLYGLLMLLPQSSAFATLRNRLNSVSSVTLLHLMPARAGPIATGISPATSSTATANENVKRGSSTSSGSFTVSRVQFQDLATHFRLVQSKHQKARKAALGLPETMPMITLSTAVGDVSATNIGSASSASRKARRPSSSHQQSKGMHVSASKSSRSVAREASPTTHGSRYLSDRDRSTVQSSSGSITQTAPVASAGTPTNRQPGHRSSKAHRQR